MIRRIPITSEAQWKELRARNIGASEVAALLGEHEWMTALQLWAKKTGALPADEDSGPMKRGRKLEPVAIDMIGEEFPTWKVERPGAYFTDDDLRLGATPDLFATDPKFGLGIVQIKTVEPSVFRRSWFDEEGLRPPPWVRVQALVEKHMTGAQWAAIAALVVGFGIDLHAVDVSLEGEAALIQTVRDEVAKFWHLVASGRRPEPDFGRDSTVLRKLLVQDDGTEVDLSADNELPDLVAKRIEASTQKKHWEEKYEFYGTALMNKLGPAQIGRFNGGYITGKTSERKERVVPAGRYRTLRIKLDKPEPEYAA